MHKRGCVPGFIRQKALRQQGERAKNDYINRAEQNRQQASQVMTWCVTIALHDLYGVGARTFDRMAKDVMTRVADEYTRDRDVWGEWRAIENLKARLGGIMQGYALPSLTRARNEWDTQLIAGQKRAGTLALAICLVTLQEGWGYEPDRLAEVLAEADANYRQFLQWALDGRGDDDAKTDGTGQYYAYAKLAEVVRQLTDEGDIVVRVEENAKPVFVESF